MTLERNYSLFQSSLDVLSTGVAILDENSEIILIDRSFQELIEKELFLIKDIGLGTNFLEVCNRIKGDRTELSRSIAREIQEVITKKKENFQLEYHLQKQNWFLIRGKLLQSENNSVRLVVSVENITKYKEKESILSSLVKATSRVSGQEFFQVLVRNLATLLQFQYVFITECLNELTPATVRILAFWCKNEYGENFEYSLSNTPCEAVFGGKAAYYPRDLQILFPQDRDLILLQVEGYIGVPMFDSANNIIGHLVAMNDRPIEDPTLGLTLMQIFAPRAALELARQLKQEQLVKDALRDRVTNLPNRNLFCDRLNLALKRFQRNDKERFAVLLLNLDRFELFRDRLGVRMTEQLNVAIVQRIQFCLRITDTFASLGGDKFAVLLEEIDNLSDASIVVDRIQQVLIPPFYLGKHEIFTSVTIGTVMSESSLDSPDAFFHNPNTIWSGSSAAHPDLRPIIKPASFTI